MDQHFFIFFFGQVFVLGLVALLDDDRVEFELDGLSLNDLLLNRVSRDEPVNIDLLLLADSVRPVHGLQVYLRIPVAVKQDDVVGGHQIDSETTGPR